MRKGPIFGGICFGIIFLLLLFLILFSDFWIALFITPTFSLDFFVYIMLPILFAIIGISLLIWRKRIAKLISEGEQFETRKIEMGVCLGSLTDDGLVIRVKSKSCSFNESLIQSMLEYSAVLYHHGEIGTLYGPFPITSIKTGADAKKFPEEEIYFVSFGFQTIDNSVKDKRNYIPRGGVLAVLLLYYPKEFDSLIMAQKKRLISLFESVTGELVDISSFSTETINRIENDVRFLSFF